ncbi:MAG: protein-export chaperone SecB [Thalassobaculum sp.]|uniref:protein-export chaperone SecB n=1 Tax=Thalassobaculum sp. TaxID=2022740 RepID=UPI0032EACC85
MSDTSAPQAAVALPIQIHAQYVKDLSFENPRAPASLQPQNEPPRIEVNVDVQAAKVADNDLYEVTLRVTASGTSAGEQLFLAELSYGGLFTLQGVPQDSLHPVLLIECPRLLFPFARAIVADVTRDGGFPPLLIQPVDFAAMFRQSASAGAAAASTTPTVAPATDGSILPPES